MRVVIFGADEELTAIGVPVLAPGSGPAGRGIEALDYDDLTGRLRVRLSDGEIFETGDLRPAGLTLSSQQW